MKIFLDCADPDEIELAYSTGMIDGVTTNPTLATKAGVPFADAVFRILKIVDGPVSLEVLSTSYEDIVVEAEKLAHLHRNVVVKVPMSVDGIKAAKLLNARNIQTNVTLVFSVGQALLAAKAGATYVSPFIGRLEDRSEDGIRLIEEIRKMYNNYNFETKILVASVRNPRQIVESALAGADVVTVRYVDFMNLYKHPLTDSGLNKFQEDWKNSGQQPLV